MQIGSVLQVGATEIRTGTCSWTDPTLVKGADWYPKKSMSAAEGGFGCIPGSHRSDEPVPAGADALVQEVPQPAGSLLVFTEALVHCTLPWKGEGERLALLYKYSPGSSTWMPYEEPPAEALAAMSERQRRLMEPPYVGGRTRALDD